MREREREPLTDQEQGKDRVHKGESVEERERERDREEEAREHSNRQPTVTEAAGAAF